VAMKAKDGLQLAPYRSREIPQDVKQRLNPPRRWRKVGQGDQTHASKAALSLDWIVLRRCGSATWMAAVRAMRSTTFRRR